MHRHARATADHELLRPGVPQRREGLVSGLAVAAVTIAALLAAAMHARPDTRPAACAECGIVEAVVPLEPAAAETGRTWQLRIRMDDGTVRTVEQRGALAAGSRVTVAGGSIRVLPNRPGQG